MAQPIETDKDIKVSLSKLLTRICIYETYPKEILSQA